MKDFELLQVATVAGKSFHKIIFEGENKFWQAVSNF